jgi:probable phosphoglycerate mutase
LTERGRAQVELLRRRLAADATVVDVLLSSAVPRAQQTADILASALGLTVPRSVNCDLCELHPGDSDGLTGAEYEARYGTFDWRAEPDRPVAPGGESWNLFTARVRRALDRLASQFAGQRVVAATHAGFIKHSLTALLPSPHEEPADPAFTAITEWNHNEDRRTWQLVRHNDTKHLINSGLDQAVGWP